MHERDTRTKGRSESKRDPALADAETAGWEGAELSMLFSDASATLRIPGPQPFKVQAMCLLHPLTPPVYLTQALIFLFLILWPPGGLPTAHSTAYPLRNWTLPFS